MSLTSQPGFVLYELCNALHSTQRRLNARPKPVGWQPIRKVHDLILLLFIVANLWSGAFAISAFIRTVMPCISLSVSNSSQSIDRAYLLGCFVDFSSISMISSSPCIPLLPGLRTCQPDCQEFPPSELSLLFFSLLRTVFLTSSRVRLIDSDCLASICNRSDLCMESVVSACS